MEAERAVCQIKYLLSVIFFFWVEPIFKLISFTKTGNQSIAYSYAICAPAATRMFVHVKDATKQRGDSKVEGK